MLCGGIIGFELLTFVLYSMFFLLGFLYGLIICFEEYAFIFMYSIFSYLVPSPVISLLEEVTQVHFVDQTSQSE